MGGGARSPPALVSFVMLLDEERDQEFMRRALDMAAQALDSEDVPVGAVVVRGDHIIGRGCNQREKLQDPTAHAEMIALTAAAADVGRWRLDGCTMYVTLEPCAMCAGALVLARLERLVFGAVDEKAGACVSLYQITQDPRLNHRIPTVGGVLARPSAELLREFFRRRRATGES
jgi:tRNA(adenine34) deaminase